ncbi:hypothetical protein [Periweissella fabalis]|uniref:Uncharacterized protein n=1 Tax=Periweissella fabalis TaxID=1070421 RepID=A0A7X6S2D4_9LACO|nr:hypothetical protein [Periweissella fabalis]MCM0599154.1 hypothetical protein [Periweissella fabalis]NKZ23433.1 hypothetical protein [Periweissella fabalis]
MVKADFSYNPYLMQTDVNINGLEPKINSPFEKYRNEKLQSWINKVPKALYDEMNGYDFELNFTGTKADFNDLKSVFIKAGITLSPVQKLNGEIIPATMQLVFKKELENVTVKLKQIRELMTWLNEHPNRKFDYKKFMTDFSWVFNEEIAYITIQDTQTRIVNFPELNVSVENINTIQELPDDINNTPIVFL